MAPNTKELEVLYENESMSSMEVDEEQQEKHMQVLPWKPRGFSRFNLFSNMLRNPIVFQSDFNFSHLNGIQVTPPKHRVASGSSSRRHDQHRSKHSRRDSSAHSCSECHSAPVHSSACPGRNSRQEAFYEDDRRHNDHECDKNCALYFKENKQKKKKPCNEVHETACCQTRYSRHPQTAISDNSMPTECYDIVRSASNYACKGRGSSAERGRQHSNNPKRHSIAHSVTHGGSCRDCRPSDYSEFKEARAHALRNPLVVPSCTKLSKKPPVCDTSCKKDCPGPAPSSGPSRGYGHAPAPPPVHTRTICGCKGAAPSAPPKVRHRVDQDDDMCQQQRHQQGARYAPSYDYAPTCSRNTFERCRSGDTLDQRSVESYPYSANENRAMSPAPRASYRGSSAPDAMDYNAMAMHCGNHGCYVPASYFRSTPAGAKRKPRNTGAKRKNTSAHLSARRTKSGYSASNMFIPAGFYMMPSTALMSYHMQPHVMPLKKRRNRNRLGGSGVSGHLKRIPRRTPSGRVLLNSYLYAN
ncbi:uncharacterized protein LOC108596845 isoform X2 [Drosophila busckii]|uniref:uncharacterized protein LOC108596845 isoform X2 n=1 Tax=Drosophila busckii TaxID=30019 RepID=UPI00083EA7E8|nr:uncharacterized protein LOC108596845 isoform X2 [Drosophila busckii]